MLFSNSLTNSYTLSTPSNFASERRKESASIITLTSVIASTTGQPGPFYGLSKNMSPMAATIFTKKCSENSVLLFHFRPSYTYYTKSLRQTGVHLLRPASREREKYFSNFLHKKPQTLCPPQGASFCPLYSYKYSIFLWVTCSYRKECSLETNKKRAFRLSPKAHLFSVGGVGGIRTHARGKPSNDLATIFLATYSL